MNGIGGLKDRLTVGKPINRHNLTVFPLFDERAPATADYLAFGAGDDPSDADMVQDWWTD